MRKLRRTADGDGAAGAGHAGDERHRLAEAEQEGVAIVHVVHGLDLPGAGVHDPQQQTEQKQHGNGDPQVAQRRLDDVLQREAEDDDRNRADDDVPSERRVLVAATHARTPVRAVLAEQASEPVRQDVDDVTTEIQDHRELGADLDDGGECRAGIRAQHQISDDADMRAGRHRKILGERLHDSQNNRLEEIHDPS